MGRDRDDSIGISQLQIPLLLRKLQFLVSWRKSVAADRSHFTLSMLIQWGEKRSWITLPYLSFSPRWIKGKNRWTSVELNGFVIYRSDTRVYDVFCSKNTNIHGEKILLLEAVKFRPRFGAGQFWNICQKSSFLYFWELMDKVCSSNPSASHIWNPES